MTSIKRDLFPLLLILGLAVILRFVDLGAVPLTGAEAYAWQQAQHPDLAYLDGPAGHALLVRLGMQARDGMPCEGAVRLGHAAVGVVAVVAAYLLGSALYSGPAGLLGAAFVALGTPFVMASRHVSVAAPQWALLALTLWLLAPLWTARDAPPVVRILLAGLVGALLLNVGLAGWLLLPGLVLALAATRPERLRQGPFWIFCVLTLLGLAPWVLWNMAHGQLGWRHLIVGWAEYPGLVSRATSLVDLAGLPVALLAVIGLVGLRDSLNRTLLVPGLLFLLVAMAWPGDPMGPLVCGVGLLLISLADSLHRWVDRPPRRLNEWFPVRALGPTLLLAGLGLASQSAIVQTMAPRYDLFYRASSVAIREETAPWVAFPRVRTARWRHHLPGFELGPWLVLEDGMAAQMAYYMDVPVYGLDAQSRFWGMPTFHDAIVVSGLRIDRDELTWHLRQDFDAIDGPTGRWLYETDASPYITVWYVRGLQVEPVALMERYAALRGQVLYD